MLNLNELVVFIEAAECGNFSEAGRRLHVSQPAVSQTIDSLQRHFGTKLFIRKGRTVRMTESGQVLFSMAKELLVAARRLDETMLSLHGEVIGEMNVGCSTASGKYLLPGLIAEFRRRYPMVRINVEVTSRQAVLQQLLSGDVAIGVSSKVIENRDIEYREFFMDEVILIAPSGHPWEAYRSIGPEELLIEPMILREEHAGTHEVLMSSLRRHAILPEMLNIAMVLGNAEAIVMAVEEGIGVAFISRLAASRSLELGRVVEVKVDSMDLQRCIYLARNLRLPATRAQMEFWDHVIQSKSILETVR